MDFSNDDLLVSSTFVPTFAPDSFVMGRTRQAVSPLTPNPRIRMVSQIPIRPTRTIGRPPLQPQSLNLTVDTLIDNNDGDLSPGNVSLREAITYTTAGGIVNFASSLTGGTIDLTLGELVVSKPLTIDGLGAENLTVSGGNLDRVFKVDDGDNSTSIEVNIRGLTVANGGADDGGGIFNAENLAVSDITFFDNGAGFGGGVHNQGTMMIEDSLFDRNSATDGAGINNDGTMAISGTTISNNDEPSYGGGILNSGTLQIENSDISHNIAFLGGGGISNGSTGFLTLIGSTVRGNVVKSTISDMDIGGGGIENHGSALIIDSEISDNSMLDEEAGEGGGIFNTGSLFVFSSTIANNTASFGAGVHNNGDFYLVESTIRDNTIKNFPASGTFFTGGGIFNANDGYTYIDSSTINDNQANRGGGIRNGGSLYVLNSTLSGNQGAARGGALFNTQFGTAEFYSSTIAQNEANISRDLLGAESTGGGGIYNLGAVNLYNTIVAENVDAGFTSGDFSPDIFSQTAANNINPASLTSGGGNLIGILNENADLTMSVIFYPTAPDIIGTNDDPIDPQLGPLQDNGGSTETHALLPGSPAIDAGDDNLATFIDQRGVTRPQGVTFDIGAFELENSPDNGTIFGTSNDDYLTGTPNRDMIDGLAGNDEIRGRQEDDWLIGSDGNDVVSGQAGNDTLYGGSGDDRLYGEAGNDFIQGSIGNDTLLGWKGNDEVSGGEGADLFILAATHGTDTFTDFTVGEDRIWMKDGLDFNDLSIDLNGGNTLISYNGETLAILNGVSRLTEASFV